MPESFVETSTHLLCSPGQVAHVVQELHGRGRADGRACLGRRGIDIGSEPGRHRGRHPGRWRDTCRVCRSAASFRASSRPPRYVLQRSAWRHIDRRSQTVLSSSLTCAPHGSSTWSRCTSYSGASKHRGGGDHQLLGRQAGEGQPPALPYQSWSTSGRASSTSGRGRVSSRLSQLLTLLAPTDPRNQNFSFPRSEMFRTHLHPRVRPT